MQSNFKEGLLYGGLCWLGLHLVALGLYQNGGAHQGNLAWRLLSVILDAERLALQIIAAAFLLGVAVLAIVLFLECFKKPPEPVTQPVRIEAPKAEIIRIDHPELTTQALATGPIKTPEISVLTPEPPPTAAELKRKALRQITGKEF